MESGEANVIFDMETGSIKGAGPVQYTGMKAMALAAKTLHPLDDLGFSYAAKLLRMLLPANKKIVINFDSERRFLFPYGDGYWSLLLNRNHIYEEEVEVFLLAVKDIEYVFIDCGANYGYWSVHVTSKEFGGHPSIAVEADAETYTFLQNNWSINSERFKIVRRAVSNSDGESVAVYGKKHEARTILASEQNKPRAAVHTISLDALVESADFQSDEKVILKLDIEGLEIAAIEGAKKLLERDIIVVYEDHGSDRNHAVTDYLMHQIGMRIYGYDLGRFRELTATSQLDGLKKNRRRGYDFFATKSEFWQEKMSELVG